LQPTPAPTNTATQPQAPAATEPRPNLPSEQTTNRPADSSTPPAAQPEPAGEVEKDPYKVEKTDNSTYLQPPKLFDPRDRTAKRGSIAPVHTAVYHQPTSYRQTSTAPRGPITAEQAQKDAVGWTTAK
jgi:hypothetical protein